MHEQKTSHSKDQGKAAEDEAVAFLQTQGLHLIERNYRCAFGEIDLIMKEADELVFIEVRWRKNSLYGDAIESIDYEKQKKIMNTATYFLQKQGLLDKKKCRFDVIGFSNTQLDWIKDAFFYE